MPELEKNRVPEASQNKIELLSIEQLRANDYNPNEMTDAEFAELIAEIRHLGRLPKPVVVRPGSNGEFIIVDGEHAWKAAKEVGLEAIPCEIIEADDFEAMRQTYKRNQHGTRNKLLLGKMFKRMGQERGLSLRDLAKEIEISEGTVRNALEYVKAVKVRKAYAAGEDAEAKITALSLRQVRLYNRLPTTFANLWLDSGADVKSLFDGYEKRKARGYRIAGEPLNSDSEEEYLKTLGEYYEKSGLLQYVKPVHSPEQFTKALERMKKWANWEQKYFCHFSNAKWYSREEFRQYARYYYEGIWPFENDVRWMEWALNMIIKADNDQASFRITPEEFSAVIEQVTEYCTDERKGLSIDMFEDYFNLAVYEKTGEKVEARKDIRQCFMQAEIDKEAPDYIRKSSLEFLTDKYALWKVTQELDGESAEDKVRIEQIVRHLAQQRFIPRDKNCVTSKWQRELDLKFGNDVKLQEEKWAVWSRIRKALFTMKAEEHRNTAGNIELAMEVADFVYDKDKSSEAHKKMSLILAQLQEAELKRIHEEITYCKMVRAMRGVAELMA